MGRGRPCVPPRCSRTIAAAAASSALSGSSLSRSGRSSRCSKPACSQSSYGCSAASSALISSSSTIRPACRVDQEDLALAAAVPLRTILAGSRSSTPTSLASTTRPSSVTQYRPGRSPFRSSTAPASVPSMNAISAGPSHGSIKRGVEPVERPQLRRHLPRRSPRPAGSSSVPRAAASGRQGSAVPGRSRSWPSRCRPGRGREQAFDPGAIGGGREQARWPASPRGRATSSGCRGSC